MTIINNGTLRRLKACANITADNADADLLWMPNGTVIGRTQQVMITTTIAPISEEPVVVPATAVKLLLLHDRNADLDITVNGCTFCITAEGASTARIATEEAPIETQIQCAYDRLTTEEGSPTWRLEPRQVRALKLLCEVPYGAQTSRAFRIQLVSDEGGIHATAISATKLARLKVAEATATPWTVVLNSAHLLLALNTLNRAHIRVAVGEQNISFMDGTTTVHIAHIPQSLTCGAFPDVRRFMPSIADAVASVSVATTDMHEAVQRLGIFPTVLLSVRDYALTATCADPSAISTTDTIDGLANGMGDAAIVVVDLALMAQIAACCDQEGEGSVHFYWFQQCLLVTSPQQSFVGMVTCLRRDD